MDGATKVDCKCLENQKSDEGVEGGLSVFRLLGVRSSKQSIEGYGLARYGL